VPCDFLCLPGVLYAAFFKDIKLDLVQKLDPFFRLICHTITPQATRAFHYINFVQQVTFKSAIAGTLLKREKE
jgi:hypothetical protein